MLQDGPHRRCANRGPTLAFWLKATEAHPDLHRARARTPHRAATSSISGVSDITLRSAWAWIRTLTALVITCVRCGSLMSAAAECSKRCNN